MTLDGIELPDDLLWVDEFDWNPVAQDIERSLTGALMVQEQAKLYGRPITLTGGDEAGMGYQSHCFGVDGFGGSSE